MFREIVSSRPKPIARQERGARTMASHHDEYHNKPQQTLYTNRHSELTLTSIRNLELASTRS